MTETSLNAVDQIRALVEEAEEVHDATVALGTPVVGTPGSPSVPEVLGKPTGKASDRKPPQLNILLELARDLDVFHTADGTAYADLPVSGHRETWPVRSTGVRRWLIHHYYKATSGAPSSEALQSVLRVLEAKASVDGPERPVFLRVGEHDGKLYLDLANSQWQAVEIDASGWRVVDAPPVRFRRAAGMLPLPNPTRGGSVAALRRFLNLRSDDDFVLVVAWLLACLRPRGPYPLLAISGEQGSAKSTFSGLLRALIDPNSVPLRALPREDRDLFVAANNGHVLAFDNLSTLSDWISDTLCRLATGGGFATRALFTDQEEVLFQAVRPIILNGIVDVVTRADLADRAIVLELTAIPEEERRPEAEIRAEFERERPKILGALLDAVVVGLRRLPDTRLGRLPRMADFALWATACEEALWPVGTFMAAYDGNRAEAVESVLQADAVATALRDLMADQEEWSGTPTALLAALDQIAGERAVKADKWPKAANALTGRLNRVKTSLRKVGFEISTGKAPGGSRRSRMIRITKSVGRVETDNEREGPSAPSAPSALEEELKPTSTLTPEPSRTIGRAVDAKADGSDGPGLGTVRTNPLERHSADDADGADANLPRRSGEGSQTAPSRWRARL